MFTFGLFTTHIPYLIFGFFYLTFYVFAFQADDKNQDAELVSTTKQIYIDNSEGISTANCYFYSISQQYQSQSPAETNNANTEQYTPYNDHPSWELPPDDFLHQETSGALFNRPPPSFSC